MPIETPSGVLEVENAKLRASSIEATIAVGIGTESNDAYPLQVFKETEPDIRIQEGSTISSASRIYSNNSNLYIQTGSDFTSGSSGDVAFQTMQGASTHMVIKGDGNVGIGTTNPQGVLHISSGTPGDAHLILEADTDNDNEADNPKIVFRQDGGYYTGEIGTDNNRMVFRSKSTTTTNTGFAFYSNVAPGETSKTDIDDLEDTQLEVMCITGDGNVGIGVGSPGTTLDVNGMATIRNQPGFQAWIRYANEFYVVSTIGSSGYLGGTGITWDEDFDIGGNFDTSTGTFTAPTDGLYMFNVTFAWDSGDGGDDTFYLIFVVDGNSTWPNRNTSSTERMFLDPRHHTQGARELTSTHTSLERMEANTTLRIYFTGVNQNIRIRVAQFNGYKVA